MFPDPDGKCSTLKSLPPAHFHLQVIRLYLRLGVEFRLNRKSDSGGRCYATGALVLTPRRFVASYSDPMGLETSQYPSCSSTLSFSG